MPLRRPTLLELRDRVLADVAARLGTGPLLPRSILGVVSQALAGATHLLYGYLDWASRQQFADTAEAEFLERLGSIWGIERKPGTFAEGTVTFTAPAGTTIPEGTQLQGPSGQTYATDEAVVVGVGGTAAAAVTALEAGVAGNLPEGTALSMVATQAGVQSSVPVAAGGLAGAEDPEGDEALRDRLLARLRKPPRGGAAHDYVAWALEVPGVTRAWALPAHLGIGTVGVAFMRDGDEDPFPDAAAVAEVQAYLDEVRPVTAAVTAFAPTPVAIDFEITLDPSTSVVQAAVEAALTDLIERVGEPGGLIRVSHVHEAISTAPGEFDHTLTAPAANVQLSAGELAVMGEVTWS